MRRDGAGSVVGEVSLRAASGTVRARPVLTRSGDWCCGPAFRMITAVSSAQNESAEKRRRRREVAGAWAVITFSIALMLNAVEAWADPDGAAWSVVRRTVSVAFALALMWWLYSKLKERQ